MAKAADESDASDAPDKSFLAGLKVFPELLKIKVVQIVLVLSLGTFMFSHAFSNWLPEILRSSGMTASKAGLWASLPVVIGMVATLIIPQLARPTIRLGLLMGIFVVAGLGAGNWFRPGTVAYAWSYSAGRSCSRCDAGDIADTHGCQAD